MHYIGQLDSIYSYKLELDDFMLIVEKWIQEGIKIQPFKKLYNAIKNKKVRVKHYAQDINNNTFIITFICGISDYKLIELANQVENGVKLGFPRGFSIIWTPVKNEFIRINAFLSKFDNDKRESNVTINTNINEVRIAKKFSGSLGLLTAFVYKNETYIVSCAKNSTGNVFSQELFILLEKWYKNKTRFIELVNFLVKGYNIAFEICSMNPELGQHGSIYKVSLPIALLIGNVANNDTFVEFLPDEMAMELFQKYELPVEHRYIIKNGSNEFIQKINEERDFMTNQQFDNIINQYILSSSITKIKGTIEHSSLTDVLEGLILWLVSGSNITILKFKFAKYTRMTMLVRDLITKGYIKKSMTPTIINEINKWSEHWVIHEKNRLKHKSILYNTLNELLSMNCQNITTNNYLNIVEPIINKYDSTDIILDESIFKVDPYKIICIIGCVGAGKSTLLQKLSIYDKVVGISVDNFVGKNKNLNVLKEIANTLLSNKIPVIENGGGFFYNHGKFSIITEVEKLVDRPVIISAIFVPSYFFCIDEDKQLAHAIEITRNVVNYRKSKEYKIFNEVTIKNHTIQKTIIKSAKNIKLIQFCDGDFCKNSKNRFEEII